jgi:dienelactone hydrolase
VKLQPRRGWIADRVPYLAWSGHGEEPGPAIIYLSGGGGRKEDVPDGVIEQATAAGATLASIDLLDHGERMPPNRAPPRPPGVSDFIRLVEQTAADLQATVAFLRGDPEVGNSPIGIRSISLSATCALAAVASGLDVQAVLSICGSADFAGASAFRLQREGLPPDEIEHAVSDLRFLPAQLDPLRNVANVARCSLMMIHGQHDQSVPLDRHRVLFEAVSPYFIDHPDDCLFLTHPGKHGIRPEVEQVGWTWLINQLTREPME